MQEKSRLLSFSSNSRSPHSRRSPSTLLTKRTIISPKYPQKTPTLVEKPCSPYALPPNPRLKKKNSQRSNSPTICINEVNLPSVLTPKTQINSNFSIGIDNLSPRSLLNPSERETMRKSETLKHVKTSGCFSAQPSPKRSDSVTEIRNISPEAIELELELTERLKETKWQGLEEKKIIYNTIFDELIEKDKVFSSLLKKIKDFYGEYIDAAISKRNKHNDYIKYKQTIEILSKENLKLSKSLDHKNKKIKELKEVIKEKDSELVEERDFGKTFKCDEGNIGEISNENKGFLTKHRHSASAPSIHNLVPKLNLEVGITKGYHEEFMEKANEFSVSWREAMKEGR
ncbi:unnamed protein product [Blepharisma stoltei]|uniref:Translin-associated factor X-interacting protein 1 N-terminal domain-containing protein n=1 Tax=Blepharisma stoltei TaxID=1481888 RepID=A0AAU9K9U2_9CILI|nr:unnamed protein product [Blepharisma stoltei]